MKEAEAKVIKNFVDNDLLNLLTAEIDRLPSAYHAPATFIIKWIIPAVVSFLDDKLAKMGGGTSGV